MTDDTRVQLEHSRAARLAAGVADASESAVARRLAYASVQLSVEPETPGALATAAVLIQTLQRQPGQLFLDIVGLDDAAQQEFARKAAAIDPTKPLQLGRIAEPTASAHIGLLERASIRVVPDNHGARLAREGTLEQLTDPSGLGIAYAAAVAAGEIFKDVAGVIPSKHTKHRKLDFCPVTLNGDLEAAPRLPPSEVNLTLVGLGAVGTATALILNLLPLRGRALLIDPQVYGRENRGTYSLGGIEDVAREVAKTELSGRALRSFQVVAFQGRVEESIAIIDVGDLPWSRVVLSGLDSVEARHSAQLLWPNLLIDSATGDTACGVHVCPDGEACLMCLLPRHVSSVSALDRLSELTTLPRELLHEGDRALSENDLHHLSDDKKEMLRPHVGVPMCGLARALALLEGGDDGYLPAIPFVAQQAACLGIGQLIRYLTNGNASVLEPNIVQYDTLVGPDRITALTMRSRGDCYSVRRRRSIEGVRSCRASPRGRSDLNC